MGETAGTSRTSPLRSPLTGLAVAAAGWLVIGAVLWSQAAKPDGQFGIDFGDYYAAAERMAAGESPYAPAMLEGPVDAQGTDRYRYPPVFAAALIPLTALSRETATVAWLAIQLCCIVVAVVVPVARGGPRAWIWPLALAGVSVPVLDALWKGNVDALLALGAALLVVAGVAVGAAATVGTTLVKLVPGIALPALVVRAPRSIVAIAATAAVLVVPTIVVWPQAWADYLVILPNLLAGSADYATNLAPASVVARAGEPWAGLAPAIRLATVGLALVVFAASIVTARRRQVWAAAVLLATLAGLLLPAAIWLHYVCVLLPFVVLAWPRATVMERAAMVAGVVLVDLGLVAIPLATLGAFVLGLATLRPLAAPRPTVAA